MLKNIITAFFSRGFVAICNFFVLMMSAHYLGSSVLGQVSLLVLNVAIIQTINEIYTGPALVFFIPKSSVRQIYLQGFLFALAGSLLLNLGFTLLGKIPVEERMHLFTLSFIISLNAFHNLLLLGKEKIAFYNLLVFLQPALMLLVLLTQVFVFGKTDFDAYVLSLYSSFGISLLASGLILQRHLMREGPGQKVNFYLVVRKGLMNQLGNLAHTLSNRLNYYLLSNMALVGVYASSTSLIESVWIISASVSPIVLSHVANQKDAANNARLSLLLAKLCFVLGLVCVLILLVLPPHFFTYVLGKDFEQVKTVMLCLSPGVLCISFSSILSHYFSGLGHQKILLAANATGLLATLCLAWPFISTFGLLGACYAASCAYFLQAAVLTLSFIKHSGLRARELFAYRLKG